MSLMERMFQVRDQAITEGRTLLGWRFSPSGYTEFIATADALWQVVTLHGAPTIIGLPYEVTNDLPGATDFELILTEEQ